MRIGVATVLMVSFALSTPTVSAAAPARVQPGQVTPVLQPLAATQRKPGPYVLRYVESQADDHLDLQIKAVQGRILLSDVARTRLQGTTYTLNGWTDPEDASRLVDEPVQPYTLYHVTKASIAAPFREWWRGMPEIRKDKPIEVRRGEVFFIIVPKDETWNGVGEGVNPIGRPLAFSQLPPFKLKNRVYGFEATFEDESAKRLDELDITFNRRPGQRHTMLYSSAMSSFIRGKGYDREPRKAIHDFTPQDCIDFADSLPKAAILSFDIEPPADVAWMIDYDHPNFVPNMSAVMKRLDERGIKGYNWMHSPGIWFKGENLHGFRSWGKDNAKMDLFLDAHAHPEQLRPDPSPSPVLHVGFGYDPYDINFLPDDAGNQNSSPQALYLKALDACEITRRAYPGKELLAFTWAYMEFDVNEFPRNHVVAVPRLNALARRNDNKPLYAPSSWQDSMTLGLVYCRYLFYWGPYGIKWDPAHVARYTQKNVEPGEMVYWEFLKGEIPSVKGGNYAGKESLTYNATLTAAWRYAQIQDICDNGQRFAAATTYRRADRAGRPMAEKSYPAYTDGSQFLRAAGNRQPFTLIVREPGTGRSVVFFQDVWSRPGQWTEFRFTVDGRTYDRATGADGTSVPLRTEGNRLFVGVLD